MPITLPINTLRVTTTPAQHISTKDNGDNGDLEITKTDIFQLDLPYSGGVNHLSNDRTYTSFDTTTVRITTANGLTGWGESLPFGATYKHRMQWACVPIAELARHLIGLGPRRVDRINDTMDGALVGHKHAKTALSIACWDIFGIAVGMPVCELLGGRTHAGLPIISSISVGTPEDMRARVADHRKRGYIEHSVKVANNDPVTDAARIVASTVDPTTQEFYLVNANGGFSPETALRTLRMLPTGLDIVFEAPCATWRECFSVRRCTDVPIIMDELANDLASFIELIAEDTAEGIGLKISKSGGLTKSSRQRDICVAAGHTLSMQEATVSDITFPAIVHLAQTVPEGLLRGILERRNMVTARTANENFDVKDG